MKKHVCDICADQMEPPYWFSATTMTGTAGGNKVSVTLNVEALLTTPDADVCMECIWRLLDQVDPRNVNKTAAAKGM